MDLPYIYYNVSYLVKLNHFKALSAYLTLSALKNKQVIESTLIFFSIAYTQFVSSYRF